jgi:hypothetical protein
MLWEGRPLRGLREADVRRIVDAGLAEHLQLEYKSALYDDGDRDRREFLLDICMFANAAGGILLIGVPERRDDNARPTGTPDPAVILGLEVANPEAVLQGYDARIMESVEERLPLESASIDVGNGRRVLALRIPNSVRKPHSVRYQGHIYFPSRRERQRYNLGVQEIKELTMKSASKLEQAQELLRASFLALMRAVRQPQIPHIIIGIIPVFFEDFLVDVKAPAVHRSVADFGLSERPEYREPAYTFDGLERREAQRDFVARFHRNGLLTVNLELPLVPREAGQHVFFMTAVDALLFRFLPRASVVYEAAGVGAPYILTMMVRTQSALGGAYEAEIPNQYYPTPTIAPGDYPFPCVQIDDLAATALIRPLCDQLHQMFGREGSPSFNDEGAAFARYPAL